MQTIHYSMPRLVFVFLAMFGMVILGAWVNIRMENGGGFYGYLIMLGGIISVPDVLRMMLNGGKILEFDHNFVTYHKLLGPARVRWDEVTSIAVEEQTVNFSTNRMLKIKGPFGLFGRARIVKSWLPKEMRPVEKIADLMIELHENPAPIVPSRQQAPAVPVAPAPRAVGFGRKGI